MRPIFLSLRQTNIDVYKRQAQGILTVRGGMTSHAAVVARGMGTCCVSGCGEIKINEEEKWFTLGGYTFKEGDYISPVSYTHLGGAVLLPLRVCRKYSFPS